MPMQPSVVKAPIVVARHLVKHEYLPWNEVSRRYVDDEPEIYVPDVFRGRAKDKKQGSDGVVYPSKDLVEFANYTSLRTYREMLEAGVCPEQARMATYLSSTMTEWWWSGTVGAWAKMCNLKDASLTHNLRHVS
jgi:thymidylate synthase (FAD)